MTDPCGLLESCQVRFGDLFTLRLSAFGMIVVVANPDAVKQVFARGNDRYECRHFNGSYRYAMGDNALFLQDGEAHRQLKRLLAPTFRPPLLHAHAETVRKSAAVSVAGWAGLDELRLRPAMHELTLRCLFALCFGERSSAGEEILDWFRTFVWSDLRAWKPWTAMSRLRPRIGQLLSRELDHLRAQPSGAAIPTLLESILQARNADAAPLSDAVIHDQFMMLMITAGDAVAAAASWTLFRMARHPEVQQALLEERAPLGPRPLAAEVLRRPFLSAMTCEVLRLHPVLPTVSGRRLSVGEQFMGFDLPAGVTLAPCQYLVHRRADIFEDPLAFRPQRFLGRTYPLQSYFPFGGSERACLGSWLAPMSVAIIADTVAERFALDCANEVDPRVVRHGTLLAPEPDLRVRLAEH